VIFSGEPLTGLTCMVPKTGPLVVGRDPAILGIKIGFPFTFFKVPSTGLPLGVWNVAIGIQKIVSLFWI